MRNSRSWVLAAACFALLATASSAAPAAGPEAAPPDASQALQRQQGARLQAMDSSQRVQFGQRMAQWKALPPREREDRRARYQAWLQLPESERIRLRQVAAEIAAYPPARRQALHAQFDALDETRRRGWRLGPALGADYESLHPLLAYVPPDERVALLAALRAMSARQRGDLAVLLQRTPPGEREALRASLVAQPLAQLEGWLQQRLAH